MTLKKTPWRQQAVLVFISVLLAVFIAEGLLRLLYPSESRYYVWQPYLHHIFHADTSILNGVQPVSRFTINRDGMRAEQSDVDLLSASDPETINNKKYYLCLGGSTTECLYLDDTSTWPAQLTQAALSVHDSGFAFIGNIGKSGCSTRENYIQLKYCAKQYKKIKTVILMVGLNDLLKRLSQDTLYDANFRFTQFTEDSQANAILLKEGRSSGKTWWRRTALFHLIQNLYHEKKDRAIEWAVEDDYGKSEKKWRENRQHATAILDSLPNLQNALKEYARNLNLLIDEAQRQQRGIIFVNQPALWKDSMSQDELSKLWLGGIGKYQLQAGHVYYSPGALRRGLEMYNARLAGVCAERKVKCVDLDSKLPCTGAVFYDDCHFTDYGAGLTAKIIYGAIK